MVFLRLQLRQAIQLEIPPCVGGVRPCEVVWASRMAWNGSYSRQWRHIAIRMDRRICLSAACKLYGISQDFDLKAQRALDDFDSGLDGDLEADHTGSRTKSATRAHAW